MSIWNWLLQVGVFFFSLRKIDRLFLPGKTPIIDENSPIPVTKTFMKEALERRFHVAMATAATGEFLSWR